jgi:antitoxin component of MazEF toxin-antitoxin module
MQLTLRRIGNSLGIIIPRGILDQWGVQEGDALELGPEGIGPPRAGVTKADLDELRFERSLEIVRRFTPREIRAKGLANLHRWKQQGSWGMVYGEWEEILRDADDGRLYAAMLGRDERSTRLRQSIPYVGLLPQEIVRQMNAKVAG